MQAQVAQDRVIVHLPDIAAGRATKTSPSFTERVGQSAEILVVLNKWFCLATYTSTWLKLRRVWRLIAAARAHFRGGRPGMIQH